MIDNREYATLRRKARHGGRGAHDVLAGRGRAGAQGV